MIDMIKFIEKKNLLILFILFILSKKTSRLRVFAVKFYE